MGPTHASKEDCYGGGTTSDLMTITNYGFGFDHDLTFPAQVIPDGILDTNCILRVTMNVCEI